MFSLVVNEDIGCHSERVERHGMITSSRMRKCGCALKNHSGRCFRSRLKRGNSGSGEESTSIVPAHVKDDDGLDHL